MNFLEVIEIEIDKKPINKTNKASRIIGDYIFKKKYTDFYTKRFNDFFKNRFTLIDNFFDDIREITSLYNNNDKEMLKFVKLVSLESSFIKHIVETGDLEIYLKDTKDYKKEDPEDFMISKISFTLNEFINLEIIDDDFKRYFNL